MKTDKVINSNLYGKRKVQSQNFGHLAFVSPQAKAAFIEGLKRLDKSELVQELGTLIEAHKKIETLVLTDGKEVIEAPNCTLSVDSSKFLNVLRDILTSALPSTNCTLSVGKSKFLDVFKNILASALPSKKLKRTRKTIEQIVDTCCLIISREQAMESLKKKAKFHYSPIGLVLESDSNFSITTEDAMRF